MVEKKLSPGQSWYEATIDYRPQYSGLDAAVQCDIAIVGGGFTGLSAAYHLAKGGLRVILVDGARFGDGASGRNGGQMGTGQRQWVDNLEKRYGFERTKLLFDLAERAKTHLFGLANKEQINFDYQRGHLSVVHRKRLLKSYEHHVDDMARYGYSQLDYLGPYETRERLGSNLYLGGIRDRGTGHINPLKLVVGLAQAAQRAGATLFENTRITKLEKRGRGYTLTSDGGTIDAQRVLLASNAYGLDLDPISRKYVVPIFSYIAATAPLSKQSTILPNFESVDDSRFVVRYFRKEKNGALLFGGAESYASSMLSDIAAAVRKQLVEVYPDLNHIPLTHHWGGAVAITVQRMPFVREVLPGVTFCGGYSGHGVMLAPFVGKLYADAVLKNTKEFEVFKSLKITPFPGGQVLRMPMLFLAMHWFSMLDWL